jgi:hypothetical protein
MGLAWRCEAAWGVAGQGKARQGYFMRLTRHSSGWVWLGEARHDKAWRGVAGSGGARHRTAGILCRLLRAWRGTARLGAAWPGEARSGAARKGKAWQGYTLRISFATRHGMAWRGAVVLGQVWLGVAGLGWVR